MAQDVKTIGTAKEFATAIENMSMAEGLQQKVAKLAEEFEAENGRLRGLNKYLSVTKKSPDDASYKAWYESYDTDKILYYKIVVGGNARVGDKIYFSLPDYVADSEKGDWKELKSSSDYPENNDAVMEGVVNGIKEAFFRYKSQLSGNVETSDGYAASSVKTIVAVFDLVNVGRSVIPLYLEENPGYTEQKAIVDAKEEELNQAKSELEQAAGFKTLRLTGNLEFGDSEDQQVVGEWTLPAGYTIDGNYYTISGTGTDGATLLVTNNGTIKNLVVSTGMIAAENTGKVTNSIARIATGNYATYNAAGTMKENIASLEDAAYELKDVYGYNIGTKAIEKAASTNRVYVAHYANATHKDVYDFKVNIGANGKVVYDKAKAETNGFADGEMSLQNAVLYIDGVDANTKVEKNVALKVDGSSIYTCAEVEMSEGENTSEFYIPLNFTATKLNYTRKVSKDMASVCFPFALTSDMKSKLGIKTYHQFKDVDATANTMWFSERSSIEANSPAVITFANEGNTVDFSKYTDGIQFTATTSNADLGSTNSNTGKRLFYGNYKATQRPDDLSQTHGNGAFVYGVQNGRLVKMASTAWLDQFRSYVVYEGDLTKENAAPSFRIGLLDENDNEIVTAVESVSADKNGSFKVMGGNNAIEVSTEKACDVKVYTVNGTLVKSVQVEAGNTSLPVKAGMYVVNGTKVIVK